jgi:hypothetical protein
MAVAADLQTLVHIAAFSTLGAELPSALQRQTRNSVCLNVNYDR